MRGGYLPVGDRGCPELTSRLSRGFARTCCQSSARIRSMIRRRPGSPRKQPSRPAALSSPLHCRRLRSSFPGTVRSPWRPPPAFRCTSAPSPGPSSAAHGHLPATPPDSSPRVRTRTIFSPVASCTRTRAEAMRESVASATILSRLDVSSQITWFAHGEAGCEGRKMITCCTCF